jgi:hypothetical protein
MSKKSSSYYDSEYDDSFATNKIQNIPFSKVSVPNL